MFQSLAETQDIDMISLLGNLFQHNTIDLCKQTLLPTDLSTLAFFLIRSVIKKWEKLDLSNCNIGSERCNMLLSLLLNKGNRNMININAVDFSYNQLNFLSLRGIFDLLRSWHTTELIIADNTVLESKTGSELFASIMDAFICKNDEIFLQIVSIGSFLFAYSIDELFLYDTLRVRNLTYYRKIFILSCTCSCSGFQLLECFNKITAVDVSFLDTHLDSSSFKELELVLRSHNLHSLFVYDSNLSDDKADDLISSDNKFGSKSASVMVLISRSTIQGVINTCSLSCELSDIEVLNLIVRGRSLCNKKSISEPSWNNDLHFDGSRSEIIAECFFDYFMVNLKSWYLKIKLKIVDNNTMIALKVRFHEITRDMSSITWELTAIYLSSCILVDSEYKRLIDNCSKRSLLFLYVLHSSMTEERIQCTLLENWFAIQELFLHSNCNFTTANIAASLSSLQKCSVVLVANNYLVVHNPTKKQLALAHRLEPIASSWKFVACQVSADVFSLILDILIDRNKKWVELDFTSCNFSQTELETVCYRLKSSMSTVKRLILTGAQYPLSNISLLAKIIVAWKVEEIIISDQSTRAVFKSLIKELIVNVLSWDSRKMFCLTVSCNYKKACFFFNAHWRQIETRGNNATTSLILVNCRLYDISQAGITFVNNMLPLLSEVVIINSFLWETMMIYLLKAFMHKGVHLSIFGTTVIDGDYLYNLVTDKTLFYNARVHFVVAVDNFLCGYNTSEHQLHLLKSVKYSYSIEEHSIATMARKMKSFIDKDLFVFLNHQLNAFYFIIKQCKVMDCMKLLAEVSSTALRLLGIDNCKITSNQIKHVFNSNTEIENLFLSSTFYSTDTFIATLKSLHKTSSLKCFGINDNCITDEIMECVLPIISNNCIEDLGIGYNNLQDRGIAKLAKVLLTGSLQKLGLQCNNITEAAADDIANVVSHNTNLTSINLNKNNLKSAGVKKVARALQCISTLTKLSLSDNSINKDAANDIAAVLSHNTNLKGLELSRNYLQSEGAISIAQGLCNTTSLQHLALQNNDITDEAADDIAAVLAHNTDLMVLDLSQNNLQSAGIIKVARSLRNVSALQQLWIGINNATEEAAVCITTVLSHNAYLMVLNQNECNLQSAGVVNVAQSLLDVSVLQVLRLSNNNITYEGADAIAAVLPHNTNLTVLDLSGNNLQSGGIIKAMRSLTSISTLEQLRLSSNHATNEIADEIADEIAAILLHTTNLTFLDLNGNDLKSTGVIRIARSLQHISSLNELHISNSNITYGVADDIASVILCNTNLSVLNLNANHLQLGFVVVARALQSISSLTKLYIGHNDITEDADYYISSILSHNPNLAVLYLSGNKLRTASCVVVARSLTELYISQNNIKETAVGAIVNVLSLNVNLRVLKLDGNKLQSDGVIKVAKALQHAQSLCVLDISDNNISKEAADFVKDSLSHLPNLSKLSVH